MIIYNSRRYGTAMPRNQDYIAEYVKQAPGYLNIITPFSEMPSELLMPYSDYRGYGARPSLYSHTTFTRALHSSVFKPFTTNAELVFTSVKPQVKRIYVVCI